MASFTPYQIHHVDLSVNDLPLAIDNLEGHYFVFWWSTVPIGEFYLSPKGQWTNENIQKKCIDSVWPALQSYSKKNKSVLEIVKPGDLEILKELCRAIFAEPLSAAMPSSCPVSVIICTRDRPDYLNSCLTYLMKQVCMPAEIIVVDNASKDERTKQVASKFNVRYVREPKPGLDVARNTGARMATQEIIAYTDDDTKPQRNWVYQVYQTFNDPTISAMTGLVMASELKTEAQMIFEKHWPFNRGYVDKLFDPQFFKNTVHSGAPVWDVGAGANMAFKKDVLRKVGYFDERLDVGAAGCSGDSELWYRILANGFSIQYNPRSVVHHLHRESMNGLHKQLYSYMRGFAVAILIQHKAFGHSGNIRHLFFHVPKYYAYLLLRGFPRYRFRYRTVLSEMRGLISGLFYFWKHRNTDPKLFAGNE